MDLLDAIKINKVSNGAVAGVTEIDCTAVDMAGYKNVLFMASLGTVTSGAVVKAAVRQSDAAGMTNPEWLAGVNLILNPATGKSDNLIALEVVRPTKRYVQLVINRTTQNSVIQEALAIQFNGPTIPVIQPDTVLGKIIAVSPVPDTSFTI